jgi:hypothetical protein
MAVGSSAAGLAVLIGFVPRMAVGGSVAGLAVLVALGPTLGVITGADVPVGKTSGAVVSIAGGVECAVTAATGAAVPVGC